MPDRDTTYEALKEKLGREPKPQELKDEVSRIKSEALVDLAERGKLPHQRRRATSSYLNRPTRSEAQAKADTGRA